MKVARTTFLFFQIGGGFYVCASGLMTFDFENERYSVPFGLGVGKVVKSAARS